ncbi:hypothetical protein GCM10020218_073440 [Dactylosporangium vinaceum]
MRTRRAQARIDARTRAAAGTGTGTDADADDRHGATQGTDAGRTDARHGHER